MTKRDVCVIGVGMTTILAIASVWLAARTFGRANA